MIDFIKEEDKQKHIIVSVVLTILISLSYIKLFSMYFYTGIFWGGVSTTLIGVGKEVYDYIDYGLFSWGDIKADLIGVALGVVILISFSLVVL